MAKSSNMTAPASKDKLKGKPASADPSGKSLYEIEKRTEKGPKPPAGKGPSPKAAPIKATTKSGGKTSTKSEASKGSRGSKKGGC
jgi:hypothetical protein